MTIRFSEHAYGPHPASAPAATSRTAAVPLFSAASGSLQLLGICGSLRGASTTRAVLREITIPLPDDIALTVWDQLATVPPFNEDDEANPALPVRALRDAITQADALVIVTPEYNGSIPGQLKSALDWASRPRGIAALAGKPAVTASASPGARGAARAQAELRTVLGIAGATVIGASLAIGRIHEHFDGDGRLTDRAPVEAWLGELLPTVAAAAAHARAA